MNTAQAEILPLASEPLSDSTQDAFEQKKAFVQKTQASHFNYFAGYYANISVVLCLVSFALGGDWLTRFPVTEFVLLAVFGVGAWTFVEYWFHRVLYHKGPEVMVIGHGMHHDAPKALYGIPYYMTVIVYMAIFYALRLVVNTPELATVMAFLTVGYIGYCGVHHGTHHWRNKFKIFKMLQRHHLVHHYHPEANFAITMPPWDYVFRTQRPFESRHATEH